LPVPGAWARHAFSTGLLRRGGSQGCGFQGVSCPLPFPWRKKHDSTCIIETRRDYIAIGYMVPRALTNGMSGLYSSPRPSFDVKMRPATMEIRTIRLDLKEKKMVRPVRKSSLLRRCVFLFLVAFMPQWGLAAGPNPLGVIQSGTERALSILRSSQKGEAPALRQRRGEILDIVDQYFNFDEMGRRALGRPWKEQSPDKQKEFIRLFKQLLFNTYINRVESYTGSNEKIVYDSEKIDGEYALVKTHALLQGSESVEINYRMRLDGGAWKVYDVVVEGISFVENYRSQFASILANNSFDVLLRKIKEKVDQSS